MQEQLSPATASIPVVGDTELRLANMRRQLEDVFRGLDLVHDEVSAPPTLLIRRVCLNSPMF
jgi:hypothetical protein